MDKASVYGLKDTRNRRVFYIGMSIDPYARYGQHLALASKSLTAKDERILDMRKEGLMPELVILEKDIPVEDALNREKFWINYHLDHGIVLTNVQISKVSCSRITDKEITKEGKKGRLRNRMEYATAWVKWEQTGFDVGSCPWRNPYEMRKRKPVFYEQAREALGLF